MDTGTVVIIAAVVVVLVLLAVTMRGRRRGFRRPVAPRRPRRPAYRGRW